MNSPPPPQRAPPTPRPPPPHLTRAPLRPPPLPLLPALPPTRYLQRRDPVGCLQLLFTVESLVKIVALGFFFFFFFIPLEPRVE